VEVGFIPRVPRGLAASSALARPFNSLGSGEYLLTRWSESTFGKRTFESTMVVIELRPHNAASSSLPLRHVLLIMRQAWQLPWRESA